MKAVQRYFADEKVTASRAAARASARAPTDVELEMIAQTWSEHCKHKIFNATIRYHARTGAEERIDSLFRTYIRATTEAVARKRRLPPLGVPRQLGGDRLRPRHPGLLQGGDPQLPLGPGSLRRGDHRASWASTATSWAPGLGAQPDLQHERPVLRLAGHPRLRRPAGPPAPADGSWRECTAGSWTAATSPGIPVAAGAFLFDESYLGKPLVFCGTGRRAARQDPRPGFLREGGAARGTSPS